MFIVNHRKIFFTLSLILVLASVLTLISYGLNLGTDFTGGSILEVSYQGSRPEAEAIRAPLNKLDLGPIAVSLAGEQDVVIRSTTLTEAEHLTVLKSLPFASAIDQPPPTEKRFSSIGPALGQELVRKGVIAIILVIILILIYIAFVFRATNNSWVYGIVVIITMIHDVIIPTGIFAWLGFYYGVEIDSLFLTAFLTILGLSVNDKIVALDRIRENLRRKQSGETFAETVGRSLSETLTRSVNTSLTVLFVLVAIFFLGSESTKYFALALALGMIVATYSSVFIAAPLLVVWQKLSGRVK